MVLAKPVKHGVDSILVQQGVELNDRLLDLLRSRGVNHVFIQGSDTSSCPLPADAATTRLVTEREDYRFGDVSSHKVMAALRDAVITIKSGCPGDWELTELTQATVEKRPDRREQIHALAKKIQDLPTLPAIYHQIDQVTRDQTASAADVAKVVSSDPVFSASLLRVANSALYSRSEAVTTVTGAVSLLGHQVIRDLCLITSVLDIISLGSSDSRPVDMFWKHAVGVGSVAHVIGQRTPGIPAEELFLAGLLHDIGQLFWLRYFPEDLALVYAHAESTGQTLLESEKELLGTVHTRLGKMIASHWNLPRAYVEVISYHHNPDQASGWHLLCQVVNVADAIAHASEMAGASLWRVPTISLEAWTALELGTDDLVCLVEDALMEFGENIKSFALFTEEEIVS